jgi:trigger factor
MQITETKSEGLARAYEIIIPAATIAEKVDARLGELSKEIKLPGFRPGKVPMNLLRQRYAQSVMGEVFEASVNEGVAKAIQDNDLKPATQPKVDEVDFDEGKDLKFSVVMDVLPAITPMDFASMTLERVKVEAPESEVTETLERIANQSKDSEPAEEGKAIEDGDIAVIDFKGEVGGESLPGMSAEDFNLEIGSGSFVPGFEEQLVGAKAGDTLDIEVKFPDDYGVDKLSGADTKFNVVIKEVRVTKAAEIDDELAKKVGLESLDQLKENIAKDIERHYSEMTAQVLKRRVLDAMDEGHSFELPESLVEAEFNGIWEQIVKAKEAGQLDEEEAAKDEEELKADYRKISERRVKLGLVMQEVASANKITIEEDDMRAALFREARRYPGQEQAFLEYMQKTPEAMRSLSAPILEQKVVDFIAELAGAKEKVISVDELKELVDSLEEA